MKITICALIASLLLTVSSMYAQTSIPVFAGKVKSINHKENLVSVKIDNAVANFYAYSPTVIRVRVTQTTPKSDFSYAVIQKPGSSFKIIREDQDSTALRTDSLQLVIFSNPFRVSVRNLKGEILSEDYSALPVSWQGSEVTCYKKLFADEKFLGLGEKTGNLNKRGSS